MSEDNAIRLIKGKRTVMTVEKAVEGVKDAPDLLGQIKDAGNILKQAQDLLKNPASQVIMGQVKDMVEKTFGGAEKQNSQYTLTPAEIAELKTRPLDLPAPTQASSNATPTQTSSTKAEIAIIPASPTHFKLMTVFNEIPEDKVKQFLHFAGLQGDENIETIRAKIKPFVS
jgi:hypothetical protein